MRGLKSHILQAFAPTLKGYIASGWIRAICQVEQGMPNLTDEQRAYLERLRDAGAELKADYFRE